MPVKSSVAGIFHKDGMECRREERLEIIGRRDWRLLGKRWEIIGRRGRRSV
jgi:hypothetical protein